MALGVFWELQFPAVCFAFEQGEPLFSPCAEVFGSGVAKVHDRGDERLIVQSSCVEFSHGVVMDKRFAIAAASYGVSGSAKADLVSWNIPFAVLSAASRDAAETTQRKSRFGAV